MEFFSATKQRRSESQFATFRYSYIRVMGQNSQIIHKNNAILSLRINVINDMVHAHVMYVYEYGCIARASFT